MEPLPAEDLARLSDERLLALAGSLEARRPPAGAPSAGVRPARTPWSYREIRRLAAVHDELDRRAARGDVRRPPPGDRGRPPGG
jgi:hypothetical protein